MTQREANLLWLNDMLTHLKNCHKQLEWTVEADSVHVLTEAMIRDLDCCRRLCEALQRRSSAQVAV